VFETLAFIVIFVVINYRGGGGGGHLIRLPNDVERRFLTKKKKYKKRTARTVVPPGRLYRWHVRRRKRGDRSSGQPVTVRRYVYSSVTDYWSPSVPFFDDPLTQSPGPDRGWGTLLLARAAFGFQ